VRGARVVILPVKVSLKRTTVFFAVLAAAATVFPQSTEPASPTAMPRTELALLRTGFDMKLIRASLPALRQYQSDLLALERRLAAARDYPAAITARNERHEVEREIARLEKDDLFLRNREQSLQTALLPAHLLLPLERAVLSGVVFDAKEGCLTSWSKSGASATWTLPGLPPGGYEVVLRYSCDALEGGAVLLKEAVYTLTAPVQTTLRGPAEKNIGTLRITDGAGTLTLSAASVLRGNLMKLHSVELIPANR
jgi:hypothetical protein